MYLRGGSVFELRQSAQAQDHIPRQNEAAGVLASVVSEVGRLKAANQLTVSALSELIARVERAKSDFVSWARSLNNDRATRGANEIEANANGVLASLRAETSQAITGPAPATDPVFYSPPPTPGYVPDDRVSIPERIIGKVKEILQPSPYPVFQEPTYQPAPAAAAFPDWFLPAAVVLGIVLLQPKRGGRR